MRKKIIEYLRQLEQDKGIKILLACETGSRSWGFPSPDSDYDVRLIYAHPVDWYLSLDKPEDTINLMLEANEIDISGWDIRKSLKLLHKSNAALLERIHATDIYFCDEEFMQEIRQIAAAYYSQIAVMHHYLGLAKNAFAEVENQDAYRLKKLLYALRAAAACRWILEQSGFPPLLFTTVLEGIKLDEKIKGRIQELLKLKSQKNETYLHGGEEEIFAFIRESIQLAQEKAPGLSAGKGHLEPLNEVFRKVVKQVP